jgi:hypothetical protein
LKWIQETRAKNQEPRVKWKIRFMLLFELKSLDSWILALDSK